MADCLSLWRTGDAISAYRLNEMTIGINEAAKLAEELAVELNGIQRGSSTAVGGLSEGRAITTAKPQFMKQNRGVILDQWDFKIRQPEECGVYVRCSGFENATGPNYPDSPCIKKIAGYNCATNGNELMQTVYTDCWGNVKCSKIELLRCVPSDTKLWRGPEAASSCSGTGNPPEYKFYRRLGRMVDACYEFSCGSIAKHKVMETNDLVMPILPVRAEQEVMSDCSQSAGLVSDIRGNSVLIKNIANGGGLKLDVSSANHLELKSGVEFYAAQMCASCCGTTASFDVPYHLDPRPFDVVIACIPVKEQHYKWCKTSNSWVEATTPSGDSTSEPSTAEPTKKGDIKITAKSLGGNNWQIGWASSGEITIPVKDFTPGEGTCYTEGRGISIKEETTTDGKKYTICNTMEICAGCNISIEQTDTDKPAYKINACKMKVEAGDGIKVECIQGGYKISACESQAICITNGAGISVTKNNNTYTISNTAIHDAIEVVEGEGIKVTQTGNKYKVSLAPPCCGTGGYKCYIFDPAWFTVTDNNVTINEAKVQAVGDGIAVNTSVNANITRVMERTITGNGYEGDIMARVNGLEGGLCATARVTWEQGTHSDA